MDVRIVDGDLLDQHVDAIVNPWNRNIIPWWLLIPQGVSGAIKRRAGYQPFRELSRAGALQLGAAVRTSAGRLPFKAIIHVAGINLLWRASAVSIRNSAKNAVALVEQLQLDSVAFPIIGAGSGGFDATEAEHIMLATFKEMSHRPEVVVVRFVAAARSIA